MASYWPLFFCIICLFLSEWQYIEPDIKKKRKARFYNTYAWIKARREALRIQREAYSFPFNFCEDCGITGNHTDEYGMPVVMSVDHIESRADNPELALEQTNLTILCLPCNKAKGTGEALPK